MSAVQEETEVRRTRGQNTYGSGESVRIGPGTVCNILDNDVNFTFSTMTVAL